MGTLAPAIEKQQRRSGRSARLVRKLGHPTADFALLQRRAAWTLRLVDLEQEYSRALEEIGRLDAEIRWGDDG